MKNMTLKTLIATAAIAVASTSAMAADDSPAAQRVQHGLHTQQIVGQHQPAATGQHDFSATGMSVAAGRVEASLNTQHINGESGTAQASTNSVVDDQGKSVAASRVQQNIADNV